MMHSPDGLGWLEHCLVAQEEHLLRCTRKLLILPSHIASAILLRSASEVAYWTPTSPDVVFQDVTCAP